MDNIQIKMLAGYLTGVEAAVVALANIVSIKCGIPKEEVAKSFRNIAAIMSKDQNVMGAKALNDIADALELRPPDPKKTLLTLIQGGK